MIGNVLTIFLIPREIEHKISYCTALFLIIAQQKLPKTPCKLYYSKGGHTSGRSQLIIVNKVVKQYQKGLKTKGYKMVVKEYKCGTYLTQ